MLQNKVFPEKNIYGALDGFGEAFLKGYTKTLSSEEMINKPVIFVYPKETVRGICAKNLRCNDYQCVEDGLEIERKMSPICGYIREKLKNNKDENGFYPCLKCDCVAAAELGRLYLENNKMPYINDKEFPHNWKFIAVEETTIIEDGNEIKIPVYFYNYTCKFGLTEVIAAINVGGEFVGAFITGQYFPENAENFWEELAEKLRIEVPEIKNIKVTKLKDEIKTTAVLQKRKNLETAEKEVFNPNSNGFINYKTEILEIQEKISTIYSHVKEKNSMDLRHRILDKVWGKNSFYEECDISSPDELDKMGVWDNLTYKFKVTRTYLFDALINMRDELKNSDGIEFNELIVFKPRSNRNSGDHIYGEIQGANLIIENAKIENDKRRIDRDFTPSIINLKVDTLKIDNKQKNQGRNNNDKQGWLKALRANENIKKYLKYKNGGDVTEGYENGELIVYFMDEHESECVGYYFELKENNKEYLKFIKYTLEQISAIFLAQWNGILAEYNGVFMKVANKSAQHEIAQIHAAMDNCNKSLGPIINMALFTKAEDLSKSYPKLPSHLIKYMKETSEYYSDMIDYTTMLSSVTLSAFAIDVDAELELKKFEPHKEFVNRLRNIYREELKSKSKKIYVIEGRNNPDYNSKQTHDDFEIIADPIKLEQAVNNIIRNAVKYSHAFTKIYLSAEQEGRDGKNGYTFTVTNFGLPIPKDPKNIDKPYDYIFNLGVRGYNSFEYLDKRGGIGFGLYIAREIAEKHGGNLFLEECFEICEYNIPLLDIYQKLSGERGFREEIAKKCKEYKEELEQKNDRYGSKKKIDIIIHKPPPNPVRAESEEDYFSSEKIDNNNDKVKFTPRYYMDRIKMPTARIRYKLWIPVNYNKEQEI